MSLPQNGVERDVLEAVLVHCWELALRHEPISVHDNFFAVGGHSLVAMRIAHRLRRTFGVPVDYALVLEHPTVAALAQRLREFDLSAPELDRASREYLLAHGVSVPDRSTTAPSS